MAERGLTPKQQRFVQEYLKDLNGTQAAIRAGYSPRTANEQAARLLAKVSVATLVSDGAKRSAEAAMVTTRDVLHGLLTEARRMGRGSKHSARVAAWAHLGKHLGLFVEKHQHTLQGLDWKALLSGASAEEGCDA